jgi:hypothetical protein
MQRRLAEAVKVNEDEPVLSAAGIRYELADRAQAMSHGGLGAIHRLVRCSGLPAQIDRRLHLLKIHAPYHESDHVLNIAYNLLCGGHVLEDIEQRRNDEVFLNAIGAASIPDPTTAGRLLPSVRCRSDRGARGRDQRRAVECLARPRPDVLR